MDKLFSLKNTLCLEHNKGFKAFWYYSVHQKIWLFKNGYSQIKYKTKTIVIVEYFLLAIFIYKINK